MSERIEQRLTKVGSILMHEGKIQVNGFEGDDCGCSEVATRALIWAIGEMQRELVEQMAKPGGSQNVSIDFPKELCEVLGIKSDWPFDEIECESCQDSEECQACSITNIDECTTCRGTGACQKCVVVSGV